MSIKKSIFKISNGSGWDEHHFETDSGQVQHTTDEGGQTTVEEALNELNSNIQTLQDRNPGADGRSLKIYDDPGDLVNGCYGEGIYLFNGYYPGAPSDWGGYMISVGVNQGSKKHIKYAFCIDGSVYFMRQAAETGTIEQNWVKVAGFE